MTLIAPKNLAEIIPINRLANITDLYQPKGRKQMKILWEKLKEPVIIITLLTMIYTPPRTIFPIWYNRDC